MTRRGDGDEDDWFRRAGRLVDEEGKSEKFLLTGRYASMSRGAYRIPLQRSSRGRAANGAEPFYLHLSHVGAGKAGRQASLADRARSHPERIYVMPPRGETRGVRELGGKFDRASGCWWVPKDRCTRQQAAGFGWRGTAAVQRWQSAGRGRGSPGSAVRYQQYVNRADDPSRREEVMADELGPIVFGSLGATEPEQFAFWLAREASEKQGGRVQARVTFEIPHELADHPREIRRALSEFVQVFAARGLPYHVAVHHPDKGGDPRNLHAHLVYSDRRVLARPPAGPSPGAGGPRSSDWGEIAEILASGVRRRQVLSEMTAELEPLGATLCTRRSGSLGVVFRGRVRDAALVARRAGTVAGRRLLRTLWAGAPSERTVAGRRDLGWVFEARKDREHQGPEWVRLLRAAWAEAANRAPVRVRPEQSLGARFYDPRSYRAMGVEKRPSEHLGAWRTGLERAGVPTIAGIRNLRRELDYRRWDEERKLRGELTAVAEAVADAVAMVREAGRLKLGQGDPAGTPLPVGRELVIERAVDHGQAFAAAASDLADAVMAHARQRAAADEALAPWRTKVEVATARARARQAWARRELARLSARPGRGDRRRVARLQAIAEEARGAESEIREAIGQAVGAPATADRSRDRIVRRRELVERLAPGAWACRFALDWVSQERRTLVLGRAEDLAAAAGRLGGPRTGSLPPPVAGAADSDGGPATAQIVDVTAMLRRCLRPDIPTGLLADYVGARLTRQPHPRPGFAGGELVQAPTGPLASWWDGSIERWSDADRILREEARRRDDAARRARDEALDQDLSILARARVGDITSDDQTMLRRRLETARREELALAAALARPGPSIVAAADLVPVAGFAEAIRAIAARRDAPMAGRPGPLRGDRDRGE